MVRSIAGDVGAAGPRARRCRIAATVRRVEVTTVADDLVVLHDGARAHRFDGLTPDTDYELDGVAVRTLPRPAGELLCRFATVNDVHFGEAECGPRSTTASSGPIQRVEPGDAPYPETDEPRRRRRDRRRSTRPPWSSRATSPRRRATRSTPPSSACYGAAFGDRLHVVRGNHDAYRGQYASTPATAVVDLPGVRLAVLDTVIPLQTTRADHRRAARRGWTTGCRRATVRCW